MIEITKDEAISVRNKFGADIGITITSRHKKGGKKKYYIEETSRVFNFLDKLHKKNSVRDKAGADGRV